MKNLKKIAAAALALCMTAALFPASALAYEETEMEAETVAAVEQEAAAASGVSDSDVLENAGLNSEEPVAGTPEAAGRDGTVACDGDETEAEAASLDEGAAVFTDEAGELTEDEPEAGVAFRFTVGGLDGAKLAYSVDGETLVELSAGEAVELLRGELHYNNVLVFVGPAEGCVLDVLPDGSWDVLPNNGYKNYLTVQEHALAEGYKRVGRMTAKAGTVSEFDLDAAGHALDYGNTEITWERSQIVKITDKKSPLYFNWESTSINWKWSDIEALGLEPATGKVWNNTGSAYDSVKLGDAGGGRNMTRLTGTFTIPEGFSTKDYAQLFSINRAGYAGGANGGDLIGVNDDFFVFVYAADDADTLDDENFMDYLAFWSGVDNQRQTIPFNGYMGTPVRRYVSSGGGSKWAVKDASLAKAFQTSDGWACDATIDNVGGTLFKRYPGADEGTEFVIDVFFFNTNASGAMDRLALNFSVTSNYTATVRYWQDAVGTENGGTLLATAGLKDLAYKQAVTLPAGTQAGELDYAKKLLAGSGSYYSGRQAQAPYTIWAEDNVIDVVYTAKPQDPQALEYDLTYAWTGDIPEGYQVPMGGKYAAGAEVAVDGTFSAGETTGTYEGETGTFIFSGWDTTALDEGRMPAANAVVTGVWRFVPTAKHTVTFYVDGVQFGEAQTVLDGQDARDPGYAAPEGYTFSGWDKEFTNVTADLDVYGTTAPISTGPEIPTDPEVPTDPEGPTDPEVPSNPTPSYSAYRVTVRYLEEGTGRELQNDYTTSRIREGRRYDVSEAAELDIDGYDRTGVDGDTTGTVRGNVTVTVWYAPVEEIIEEETPLAPAPGVEVTPADPELPGEETDTVIDITEEEVPLGGLPELPQEISRENTDVTGETIPAPTGETVLVDEDIPLGNLPQTGTTTQAAKGKHMPAMAALALSLAAAVLAVGLSRKKEDGE